MAFLPTSPRRRRRFAWSAALAGLAAATAIAVVAMPGGKERPPDVLRPGPTGPSERRAPFTPAVRKQVSAVVDAFVPAAVERRDLAAAWELAGPGLRAGLTKREWVEGDLPVYPYPARPEQNRKLTVIYSYENRVGVDVLLQPRPEEKLGAIAVAIELKRRDGDWKIDAWYPVATFAAPDEHPWVTGPPDFAPGGHTAEALKAPRFAESRLDARWLLVPAAIVGGLLAILLALGIRALLRRRRAERAYRAASRLPPS